jgi:putative Ca2+/H+ antiporter (TMEM165/GDT1 family)
MMGLFPTWPESTMEAFLGSIAIVALAETGDKITKMVLLREVHVVSPPIFLSLGLLALLAWAQGLAVRHAGR